MDLYSVVGSTGRRAAKRAALELWGEHVTAIAEGRDDKVVPLRAG